MVGISRPALTRTSKSWATHSDLNVAHRGHGRASRYGHGEESEKRDVSEEVMMTEAVVDGDDDDGCGSSNELSKMGIPFKFAKKKKGVMLGFITFEDEEQMKSSSKVCTASFDDAQVTAEFKRLTQTFVDGATSHCPTLPLSALVVQVTYHANCNVVAWEENVPFQLLKRWRFVGRINDLKWLVKELLTPYKSTT
ncbi:hypothetical protein RJT34_29890 [Clitoria ternatea]|uniref:Uncharacterized protein n=1 Tax=Clitoria ternatea TaxID=43366 RepID=A0AAN9EZ15_CLITE